MRPRPRIPTTLAVAALVATAVVPLRQVFGDWDWTTSVMGATLLGAAVASAVESVRPRPPLVAPLAAGATGATMWTLVVVFPDRFFAGPLAGELWRDLRDGVFDGWSALLDETIPLTDPVGAEVFATFLAWTAAAIGVHVAARRTTALAAVATAAVVLLATSSVALPRQLTPAVVGAGAGAIALVVIATLGGGRDEHWRPARLLSLVAMVAAAGVLATIAGELVATVARDPVDPRVRRGEAVDDVEVPDLLASLERLRQGDEPLLSVDAGSLGGELRLRLQVYDRHDGERWLPVARFDEVATIPEPEQLPPGQVITLRIVEQDAYSGPWLPLPDRLIDIGLQDLRWNGETQTALRTEGPPAYDLTGTVVTRDLATGLTVAEGVDERFTALPEPLPEAIRAAALEAAGETTVEVGTDTGGEGDETDEPLPGVALVEAVTEEIRSLGRDESAAPGHSLARLRDDLTAVRPTGAEQLASLHALMLRSLGVPARLVVGYRTLDSVVVPGELGLWVEVAVADVGWVAYDPVPPASEAPADLGDTPSATTTTVPRDTVIQAQAVPQELGPGEDPGEPRISIDEPLSLADILLLAASGIALLVAALVVIRIVRRRIRHRRGKPAAIRVLGAWAELVDRLRELGAPVTATTTVDDVVFMATAIDPALGGEARALGNLTRAALHGPVSPGPDDGDEAWARLAAAEREIVTVRGRPTTLRRYLDPRVLRHRAPVAPATRTRHRRRGDAPAERPADQR